MNKKKKTIKYHTNKRKYDCGIVAIINSFKWAGQDINYSKHKRELDYLFEYIPEHGIELDSFKSFMRKDKYFPFTVGAPKENITITDFRNFLSDNTICLALIQLDETTMHACLITKLTKNYLTLINWDKDKAIKRMSVDRFKKYLRNFNLGYFITKKTVV